FPDYFACLLSRVLQRLGTADSKLVLNVSYTPDTVRFIFGYPFHRSILNRPGQCNFTVITCDLHVPGIEPEILGQTFHYIFDDTIVRTSVFPWPPPPMRSLFAARMQPVNRSTQPTEILSAKYGPIVFFVRPPRIFFI